MPSANFTSFLPDVAPLCPTCADDPTQSLVFWLCIVFGFGFFLLLIVVVFLLSAVTCSCVSTEVDKKAERKAAAAAAGANGIHNGNGVIEEFDPYAKSWHGSQYGSR
jgi:Na+-transporting methylmalonyl-CoA/oxaloacetate decarboxylase gamma subunit